MRDSAISPPDARSPHDAERPHGVRSPYDAESSHGARRTYDAESSGDVLSSGSTRNSWGRNPGEAGVTADVPLSFEVSRLGARCRRWWADRRVRFAGPHRDRGMSTAEYAVGTIAACAFAALLFKIVNSPEVNEMLSALIDRALKVNG